MKSIGIYVHIPFCQKKCKYCDFVSFDKFDDFIHKKYVNALVKEIENCNINEKINTIYIGGGTPSLISSEYIKNILNKIYEKFEVMQDAEITIEINPGTANEEKLQNYMKVGINRISFGLQSCNDRILKLIGRIHTYNEFGEVYDIARKVGFENINVDLMIGIPTQTILDVEDSLKRICDLNPEHISVYSLIFEEGTELERLVKNGELNMLSENLERQMYWKIKRFLERKGYKHYEISNFAKDNFESKHNLNCWNQDEYIGFGISAHSYINKKRISNKNNIETYIENIEVGKFNDNINIEEYEQSFESEAKEYMMINLRKINGISISKFEQKFDINPLFYFRFEISKLEEMGLIEVDLDNIKLTNKGLDLANVAFEEFV